MNDQQKYILDNISLDDVPEIRKILLDKDTTIENFQSNPFDNYRIEKTMVINYKINSPLDQEDYFYLNEKSLEISFYLRTFNPGLLSHTALYCNKTIIKDNIYQLDPNTIPSPDILKYLNSFTNIIPNTIKNYLLLQ